MQNINTEHLAQINPTDIIIGRPQIYSITGSNISNRIYNTNVLINNSLQIPNQIIYTIQGSNLTGITSIIYTPINSSNINSLWDINYNQALPLQPGTIIDSINSDGSHPNWSYENNNGTSIIVTVPNNLVLGQYYVQINSNDNYSLPYFYNFTNTIHQNNLYTLDGVSNPSTEPSSGITPNPNYPPPSNIS